MTDDGDPDRQAPDPAAGSAAGSSPAAAPESVAASNPAAAPESVAASNPAAGADSEADPGPVSDPEPGVPEGAAPVSGLRNPAGALRGVGAGVLSIEALVLLLAVLPLRMLKAPGWGMAAVAILAALAVVLIGLLKRRWAWYAGIVLQALVIATGLAHWSVAVIGCIFAGIWLYVLHIRRTILGRI